MPNPILQSVSLSQSFPQTFVNHRKVLLLSVSLRSDIPIRRKFLIVEDIANSPIEGATVTLTDSLSVLLATLTSRSDGSVWTRADSTAVNPITMVVSKAGYRTYTSIFTMVDNTFFEVSLLPDPTPTYFITVEDSAGNPISGVTVTLTDAVTTEVSATTDGSGQVARTLYAGLVNPVTLKLEKLGYETYSSVVTLGDETVLEIAMKPFTSSGNVALGISIDQPTIAVTVADIAVAVEVE